MNVVGDGSSYGAGTGASSAREVFCRVALDVEDPAAFTLLRQEANTAMVSMVPGMPSSMMLGAPMPMARIEAFLLPAAEVTPRVTFEGVTEEIGWPAHRPAGAAPETPAFPPLPSLPDVSVPLAALAWTRSGDKGGDCAVGVVARDPNYLPYISAALDEATIAACYTGLFPEVPRVHRYHLPGAHALNIVLEGALGDGCASNLRLDPMGKSASQDLLDVSVPIAQHLLAAQS